MIVAVGTPKGGVGKTTTSTSLAAGLARRGKQVLLVDVDWQANASKSVLPDYQALRKEDTVFVTIMSRQALPVRPTRIPNLSIVPSHILLSNSDMELTPAMDHREARLKNALDPIKDRYDFVVIDCPPHLGWLTVNAFTVADGVLVPVAPGYFELDSIAQLNKTLSNVQEFYNPAVRLMGFLFTRSEPDTKSKTSLKILRQTYTDAVLTTIIPENVDIGKAQMMKQDIFEYNPQSKSAEAYSRLIDELFYAKEAR
jgi:chromosome partitioning protein